MGVRTSLLAITATAGETSTTAAAGQDLPGMLNFAAEKVADALQVLNAINAVIPAGSNKTAIAAQITALT
ncbi:hypothetical protein [Paraburkholderia caribensis]|jgi:hypothetical protein|uniref:hypothetical protein n=1 Tax=Paraburkholderia caribensis TaxID=75105 RepID=UPI00285E12E3|nr:hypothetical protein [Paraburkholderia caribensis]MDR6381820.1 hypothetical protein [Paraburkholderia caribensis]